MLESHVEPAPKFHLWTSLICPDPLLCRSITFVADLHAFHPGVLHHIFSSIQADYIQPQLINAFKPHWKIQFIPISHCWFASLLHFSHSDLGDYNISAAQNLFSHNSTCCIYQTAVASNNDVWWLLCSFPLHTSCSCPSEHIFQFSLGCLTLHNHSLGSRFQMERMDIAF